MAARAKYAEGLMSLEALRHTEDEAIRAAVEKQRAIGLDIVSDGELRRASWLTGMADAVDGFMPEGIELRWHGPGVSAEQTTAKIVGAKLQKRRKLTELEVPLMQSLSASLGVPFKVTLPAPSNFVPTGFKFNVTDRIYKDREALLADLAAIIRDEIQWLISHGVTYIQVDAPFYSHYLDPEHRKAMEISGSDPDRAFDMMARGDNSAWAGLPRDGMTLAVHVCRGNSRSRWYAEGSYDAIAERLFATLDVDRYLLEYDNDRAGSFKPLRFVPRGTDVVLGLVTTKEPALEREDDLRRRIDEASRYVPLEHLALSPQCGFASIAAGNLLSEEDQWKKLALVASVARKTWGDK
jgi:5-methyltetrahydropteroyltriglutamate--homocysteine methyltransferase